MVENLRVPADKYLDYYTMGLQEKNPGLAPEEIVQKEQEKQNNIGRSIEDSNCDGIPDSVQIAYKRAKERADRITAANEGYNPPQNTGWGQSGTGQDGETRESDNRERGRNYLGWGMTGDENRAGNETGYGTGDGTGSLNLSYRDLWEMAKLSAATRACKRETLE